MRIAKQRPNIVGSVDVGKEGPGDGAGWNKGGKGDGQSGGGGAWDRYTRGRDTWHPPRDDSDRNRDHSRGGARDRDRGRDYAGDPAPRDAGKGRDERRRPDDRQQQPKRVHWPRYNGESASNHI